MSAAPKSRPKMTCAGTWAAALAATVPAVAGPAVSAMAARVTANPRGKAVVQPPAAGPSRRSTEVASSMRSGARAMAMRSTYSASGMPYVETSEGFQH